MFKDGIIDASFANFGYIPYGHAIVSWILFLFSLTILFFTIKMGRIYFDKNIDTLCSPVPQQEFQFTSTINEETFMTPLMLADRGGCSFVTKVRNMEDAGAAVGIVVDSSDEPI